MEQAGKARSLGFRGRSLSSKSREKERRTASPHRQIRVRFHTDPGETWSDRQGDSGHDQRESVPPVVLRIAGVPDQASTGSFTALQIQEEISRTGHS